MIRFGAVLVSVVLLLAGSSAAADPPVPDLYPIPGQPVQVSTELAYNAFPQAATMADGRVFLGYKSGHSHNGPGPLAWYRTSSDGVVFTAPWLIPGQSPSGAASGYSWGPSAVAAETAAQGGRVFVALTRLHWRPGTQQVDDVDGYLAVREPDGTWLPLRPLPNTGLWFYPSGMIVLSDGSLMVSGYPGYTSGAYYYRSTNRGVSWQPAGVIPNANGRPVVEPTLTQLPNGSVITFLRSDYNSQWLYRSLVVDPGSGKWLPPTVATYNGSGLPTPTVVNGTHVLVPYRGYSGPPPSAERPARLLLFRYCPDEPLGLCGMVGNIDPVPGFDRMFLYGQIVKVAGAWRLFVSIEGAEGLHGHEAVVYSVPLELRGSA